MKNSYTDTDNFMRRVNSMDTQNPLNNYKDQTFGKKVLRHTENMQDMIGDQYKRDYLKKS